MVFLGSPSSANLISKDNISYPLLIHHNYMTYIYIQYIDIYHIHMFIVIYCMYLIHHCFCNMLQSSTPDKHKKVAPIKPVDCIHTWICRGTIYTVHTYMIYMICIYFIGKYNQLYIYIHSHTCLYNVFISLLILQPSILIL